MTTGTTSSSRLNGLDLESRQMVLDAVHQVRKRLLPKKKVLELDKCETFPEEILREMMGPEYGLQLLFVPEEYGGMGGGARDACAMVREMSRICLGIATGFFALQLGAEPIVVGGTGEQKRKWLGRIAEGNSLVAYAVTEASAGSNLAALQTKADPVSDKTGRIIGYRINGSKQFISTGGYADFITLLAKTPEGPTFFIIEKGTKGFIIGRAEEKHGIRASNTSALTLEDVFVPIENLVGGTAGQGLIQASKVFGNTRLMVAGMALGAADSALEIVIPYAKERVQFGTPLSQKQGYTHKLVVPHAVRMEAAAAYIEEAAARIDAGETDMQVEGSIAKYFATESANALADAAIQALGGYGYITEYEVEKIKRDVKITCIYEGTSEIQQTIIATFRWKKTRKSKGEYYGSIAAEMDALHAERPSLGAEFYAMAARALNETIQLADEQGLTREQYLMFKLADMMTHLEVGVALARKARGINGGGDPAAKKLQVASRIFAREVAGLVAADMMTIVTGTAAVDEQAASAILERLRHRELAAACRNAVRDMDLMADVLFDRR